MKLRLFRVILRGTVLFLFFTSCAGSPDSQESDESQTTQEADLPTQSPPAEEELETPESSEPQAAEAEEADEEADEDDQSSVIETQTDQKSDEPEILLPGGGRKHRDNFGKPIENGKSGTDSPEIVQETEDPDPAFVNPLLDVDRPFEPEETELPEPVAPVPESSREVVTTSPDSDSQGSGTPGVTQHPVEQRYEPDLSTENSAARAAAPTRLLDTPGEFTITLEDLGWIFRSDRSTPGSWRFLERKLSGNSTDFRFRFTEPGTWDLVFERQDLSSGGTEEVRRLVVVGDDGELSRMENGPVPKSSSNPIPGILPSDADARNQAAQSAADQGRFEDAMKFWEIDASRNDETGRRARESLIRSAVQTESLNPLITWLPEYLNDNPDPDLLLGALNIFEAQAGYDDHGLMILEKLVSGYNGNLSPEWLYRLARYLEKPGNYRNLDRSATLYQQVINGWPLSEWRDKSDERLLWLQRHYFRVR